MGRICRPRYTKFGWFQKWGRVEVAIRDRGNNNLLVSSRVKGDLVEWLELLIGKAKLAQQSLRAMN